MVNIDDYIIYVNADGEHLPAFVEKVHEWLVVDLVLCAPYEGKFEKVVFSADKKPISWFQPSWGKEVESFKVEYGQEPNEINLQKDDPKSDFFVIPDAGRNPTFSLTQYWYNLVGGTMPFKSQLKPAKELIGMFGFEDSCRAVKTFASKKYTLRWLAKNPDVVLRAIR